MADSARIIPWALASGAVITLDKVLGNTPVNPKDYAGAAFAFLALMLFPSAVGIPFALLVFIAILIKHSGFLGKLFPGGKA